MRRSARTSGATNQTFYLLLAVGALAILGLLALSIRLLSMNPSAYALDAAATGPSAQQWLTAAYPFGIRVLAAILAACLIAGAFVLAKQFVVTRNLLRTIGPRQIRVPQRIRALSSVLGMDGKIDLIDDSRLYSFCYGFFRPKVCISHSLADSLTGAELKAVLLHEKFHLENRDPLKILLSRAVAEMLFLLPVASNLRDRYIRAKELAADDATVEFMGTELPLASALLKILRRRGQVLSTELAAIGALSVTEQRIERLLDPTAEFLPAISMPKFVTSMAMLAMLFVVSIMPIYAQPGTNVVGPNCHAPNEAAAPVATHNGPLAR